MMVLLSRKGMTRADRVNESYTDVCLAGFRVTVNFDENFTDAEERFMWI